MTSTKRTLSLLSISAAAFLLGACDRSSSSTMGEKIDAGIERTQQAATEAKQDVQAAGNEIKQEASQAASAIADGAAEAAITAKVKAALAADAQLSALAIDVDSKDDVVTLTGPAPTREAADRATSLAKAVEGVTEVRNQLVVGGSS
jgi:hyperosmotically inducible periplasmic protein